MLWKADNGDGTYTNPILYADYSDPDAIRVGEDYYLTASTFTNVPGLPVLHSKDLVNWEVISYALQELPGERFKEVQHGCGVWAPSIRYHDGKFWICFPMPDEGIFMTTASDPKGPWSEPFCVKSAKGWIDPCPLWDDDGKAYLVHAFARSRAGINCVLAISEMKPDGTGLIGEDKIVIDGHDTQPTLEGPKIYKRGDYYYILAPAGSVPAGWQTAFRSKNIWGPYEEKIVMIQGNSSINGPHQGALVDTPSGEDWFIHFRDIESPGRICYLEPVKWLRDWPRIGTAGGDDIGFGEPVETYKKPNTGAQQPITEPAANDEFDGSKGSSVPAENEGEIGRLSLAWQWNCNTKPGWYQIRKDHLELNSQKAERQLCDMPSLLLQKWPVPSFVNETSLDATALFDGEIGGMIVMSKEYKAIGVRKSGEGEAATYHFVEIVGNIKGDNEVIRELEEVEDPKHAIIRVKVMKGETAQLSYGSHSHMTLMSEYGTVPGHWVGVKNGLFAIAPNKEGKGKLVVDYFRFESFMY